MRHLTSSHSVVCFTLGLLNALRLGLGSDLVEEPEEVLQGAHMLVAR